MTLELAELEFEAVSGLTEAAVVAGFEVLELGSSLNRMGFVGARFGLGYWERD